MNEKAKASEPGTMTTKQIVGIILALAILGGMFLVPTSEALTYAGRNILGLLIAVIVMLVTWAIPMGTLCTFIIPLVYVLGCVDSPADGLQGFAN